MVLAVGGEMDLSLILNRRYLRSQLSPQDRDNSAGSEEFVQYLDCFPSAEFDFSEMLCAILPFLNNTTPETWWTAWWTVFS